MTDPEIPGVDYSSGRPGGKALAAAGVKFAARYLSNTASKNLSAAEADDLAAHGVSSVVVWETTAQRAGDGRAAGVTDAQRAAAQAKACGMPSSRPIYFAVDYDADPKAVVPYFQGIASVLGVARTGVYGGYRVVRYLLDGALAAWAWQTVAWSQGHWDARAHIRQYASTVRINGVQCDHDTAYATDYGQWTPGHSPLTEDTMPITQADAKLIAKEVASYSHGDDPDVHQTWATAAKQATAGAAQSRTNGTSLTTLAAKVDKLAAAAAPTIDYAKLAAALIAAVKES